MRRGRLSARTLANRANARKSTGPKTEGGRARVARNAATHSLSGARQLGHDPATLAALLQEVRDGYPTAWIAPSMTEPLIFRVADALLTLIKIRALRTERWRGSGGPAAIQPDWPIASLATEDSFDSEYLEGKHQDFIRTLGWLDRYEQRAFTRLRVASKTLAELVAAHPNASEAEAAAQTGPMHR